MVGDHDIEDLAAQARLAALDAAGGLCVCRRPELWGTVLGLASAAAAAYVA